MKTLKNSSFDVLPDDIYRQAQFNGARFARMAADGIAFNRLKLEIGAPTPLIMGRRFEQCFASELSEIEIEALALQAGSQVSLTYALEKMIERKHAEVRGFEAWIRNSKLHLGIRHD